MIATSAASGAERRKYPTRSVYPAVLVNCGSRWFAILNFDRWVDEPKGTERIADFLRDLERVGGQLEVRLRARLGISLVPLALEKFPGFPDVVSRQRSTIQEIVPLPDSTADRAATADGRTFVVPSRSPALPPSS